MDEPIEQKRPIDRLLEEIARAANPKHPDRGKLAAFRHCLNDETQMLAWPYLAQHCDLTRPEELLIFRICAGAAATLQPDGLVGAGLGVGNLGASMRHLALCDQKSDKKEKRLESFAGRLRRLLASRGVRELFPQLVQIVHALSAKGVELDVRRLFYDLSQWDRRGNGRDVRMEWAQGYWGGIAPGGEEERGHE